MSEALRVFIASSSEQIPVARQVAATLAAAGIAARVWDEETFDFSESYIESLEKELARADFAVVVLTADDSANVRSKVVNLPRDNVIFELGLFTGRLGRHRCFFLVDGSSNTQVASDLSGVNYLKFFAPGGAEPGRADLAALIPRLRAQMLHHGTRRKVSREAEREQERRFRLSHRLAGCYWERMRAGDDEKSALCYVTVLVDEVSGTPVLQALAYDLAGQSMATWRSVITGLPPGDERRIHYLWTGGQERQHGQAFGGSGEICFDDEGLDTALGYFYTTNFARLDEGSRTQVKHFALYRAAAADQEIMRQPWSDEATALIMIRLRSLRGR